MGLSTKLDTKVLVKFLSKLDKVWFPDVTVLGNNEDTFVVASGRIVVFREAVVGVTDKTDVLLISAMVLVATSGPIVVFREAIVGVTDNTDVLLTSAMVLVAGDGNEEHKSNVRWWDIKPLKFKALVPFIGIV